MKNSHIRRFGLLLAGLSTVLTFAAAVRLSAGPATSSSESANNSGHSGLHIALRTSGRTFRVEGPLARESFTACAYLTNLSRRPVSFTFASPYAAEQVFKFRVLDSSGEQLWESDQNVRVIGGETVRVLAPRRTWRRCVEVPLSFEGQPLSPGVYTLVATVDAEPSLQTSTTFRVVGTQQPPAAEKRLVYSVETVTARYIPTFAPPPELAVEATGTVVSGGWTDPELRLRGVSRDGFLEFDFVAKPPPAGTIVIQALQPISASTQVQVPDVFNGVRVYTQTNRKEIPPPK